jgi:hypothetical protein
MRSEFRQHLKRSQSFLLELSLLLFPGVSTEKFPWARANIAPKSLTGLRSQVDRDFEAYDGSTRSAVVFV